MWRKIICDVAWCIVTWCLWRLLDGLLLWCVLAVFRLVYTTVGNVPRRVVPARDGIALWHGMAWKVWQRYQLIVVSLTGIQWYVPRWDGTTRFIVTFRSGTGWYIPPRREARTMKHRPAWPSEIVTLLSSALCHWVRYDNRFLYHRPMPILDISVTYWIHRDT